MADTYITTGTLKRDGEIIEPGAQIELSEEEAAPLLALDPPPIREPETAAPSPAAQASVAHPLAPDTIAELEAILPVIDDVERLEAALAEEETKGGQAAIEARLDELAGDG